MNDADTAARPRRGGGRPLRLADGLAVVVGAGVLALAALRAARVPITCDEAFSYLGFVSAPIAEAFSFAGTDAANNHLLLTVLDRLLFSLLGPSELVLRLPVLLSFAAALAASWLLLRGRCAPALALAAFLTFAANRFVVELFSLARGYGLAVGLSVCGLVLLVRSIERDLRPRPAVAGLTLLVLAALAQLTLLDVWAAASAAFLLVALRRRATGPGGAARSGWPRALGVVALPALLCAATAIPIAFALSRGGALYAGGRKGLVDDTIGTVVRETLAPAPWADLLRGPATVAVLVAAAFVLAAVGILLFSRAERSGGPAALFVGSTFLLYVLAIEVQVLVFGVGYPVDRMALPLVPLLAFATALAAAVLLPGGSRLVRRGASALAVLLCVASVAQLAATADVTRSRLWWFDADAPRVLDEIGRQTARVRPADGSVSVGCSWILEPSLNYYRVVRGLTWLLPLDRKGLAGERDFYVVATPDMASPEAGGLETVRTFAAAGTVLAVAGAERLRSAAPPLVATGGVLEPVVRAASGRRELTFWIPAVVHASGFGGALWRSDLRVRNRSEAPARIVVGMSWNGERPQRALVVAGSAESLVPDVAGQLGVEGAGPLEVRVRGDVEISARVYDGATPGDERLAAGSWFSAVHAADGLGSGAVGRLEGLEESDRRRTNLGVLNLGPSPAEVSVSWQGPRGNVLVSESRTLGPEEWLQETRPLAPHAEAAPICGATARVSVIRGTGIVAWATVIDSVTHETRVVSARRE